MAIAITHKIQHIKLQSKKESISLRDGADRTVVTQIVAIPTTYAGDTVELFMAFITADGSAKYQTVLI